MVTALAIDDLVASPAPCLRFGPISTRLAGGQWQAWIGPNGCGKTSLFRAMLALDRRFFGRVTFFGQSRAQPQQLGVLLQHERPSHLMCREVIDLGQARGTALHGSHDPRVVDQLLAIFDLTSLARHKTNELSGGQWQRVRLARALACRPSLLLFDEPTNHLDGASKAALLHWLLRLRPRPSMVVISHDRTWLDACDDQLDLQRSASLAPALEAGR